MGPVPLFIWKKTPDEIITNVKRSRTKLALVNSQTDH